MNPAGEPSEDLLSKLRVSIAVGNYDRTQPLMTGEVQIEGTEPIYLPLSPEEMFFRAFRDAAFDVSELSLSSFAIKTANDTNPYVAIPVFPSRAFRHGAIYVRTDRGIRTPADLIGRRIGTPEFQLTANVWVRALLQEEYGVKPADIRWVRGGMAQPGRKEKIALQLPADLPIEDAPQHLTLSQLLERGEIDGLIGPRAPACLERKGGQVAWLFGNPEAAAREYFRKTRLFPIMHVIGVRRELAEEQPWLPMALTKAFAEAKQRAWLRLRDTATLSVMLPFMEEQLKAACSLMGEDLWPYGFAENQRTLEYFLRHHHAQGLSARRLQVEELFHPSTLEAFRL